MKKSWGFTEKILKGQKQIESRWYQSKRAPWGQIAVGDSIFFKNSGELVSVKATVGKVLSFAELTPQKVAQLLAEYGEQDGIEHNELPKFYKLFKDKRYCLLIFLKDVEAVTPFQVNKHGFGAMSAWICTQDISRIILH